MLGLQRVDGSESRLDECHSRALTSSYIWCSYSVFLSPAEDLLLSLLALAAHPSLLGGLVDGRGNVRKRGGRLLVEYGVYGLSRASSAEPVYYSCHLLLEERKRGILLGRMLSARGLFVSFIVRLAMYCIWFSSTSSS